MKQLCLLGGVLFTGLLLLGAGCGGDPNVEGAKLALTLDEVDYADYYAKLDQSIEADPTNAEAYLVKGRLLQRQAGEVREVDQHSDIVERMVEAFNNALEVNPEYSEATQELRKSSVAEFQLGIQAFNRGREDESAYNEAVQYFENTSTIQPDSSGPYVNKAYALINAGRQDDSIEPFEKALELGESEADTYLLLANIYQNNDRVSDAVQLLEKAREMFPEREDIQSQLLNSYIASGQMDRAMSDYGLAVEREPDNKLYRYNYGTLLLEAEEYDDAAEQFQAAIRIDPDYGVAYYNLGATYVNKAVEINEQITTLDDELRANRSNLSASDIEAKEAELNDMVEERKEFFSMAIEPLESARRMMESEGESAAATCQALFTAYAQVGEEAKAQDAAECAGIDLN
jgi:tetratricopeptide (TPR) repeat protein